MQYPDNIKTLVEEIHKSPTKAYIACSGGGSEVFPLLLSNGGGSATLIGGFIPYNLNELKRFIGPVVNKAVSEETALLMAKEAYKRAFEDTNEFSVCGIGLTASLQRVPEEREGRIHEIYAVLYSSFKIIKCHFVFATKTLEINRLLPVTIRNMEEFGCSVVILKLLEKFSGIDDSNFLDKLNNSSNFGELKYWTETPNAAYLQINDEAKFIKQLDFPYLNKLIFPGSFNPPHFGHKELIEMAKDINIVWTHADLEISIENVDKGVLTNQQIVDRINTIKNSDVHLTDHILITRAPTFVEKAKLFPGAAFIIGWDTAIRIIDPKYAGPVDDVLKCFEDNHVRFILFPRGVDGSSPSDLDIFPKRFLKLVTFVHGPRLYGHLCSRILRNS